MSDLEVREERDGKEPREGLEGDGGDGDEEEANPPHHRKVRVRSSSRAEEVSRE
jgi:hypothetical protein